MFGRKKESDVIAALEGPAEPVNPKGYTPGKGTPTPKRKDVEASKQRPIVADRSAMTKEEKKARKAENRAHSDAAWERQQHAMKTGDERNMPAQHAGPVRRFSRDYLDARPSLGVGFMPLALVLILTLFIKSFSPTIFTIMVLAIYIVFIVMVLDSVWAVRNSKILIEHKFGEGKVPARFTWQMISRTFYLPRWRMPKPMVKLGQYPDGGSPSDLREARKEIRQNKKLERSVRRETRRSK